MITLKRILIALIAITASGLLVVGLGIANAETPAERCKRETTAYNNTWKNTWAQANPGKSPSDAPSPPVPYKCGGGNDGPPPPTLLPSTSTPEASDTTEAPTSSGQRKDGSGPKMNAPTERREIENSSGNSKMTIGQTVRPNQTSLDQYGRVNASDEGNDGNGGLTSDSSSYADKLSGITIYANSWACALYWKHCSFKASAKTYRDGERFPVSMIKNVATAKTHGIKASVSISGGTGKGGTVGLTAEGTDKNSKTLTWVNNNSYISDVAGTADCGMFSTYFSLTSEGWFEHKGAKGYVSSGVRN